MALSFSNIWAWIQPSTWKRHWTLCEVGRIAETRN